MIQTDLHKNFCTCFSKLSKWFHHHSSIVAHPIYSSYDIRDSGFKISNVDANIYPAGFNNICHNDRDFSIEIMKKYLNSHYDSKLERILLVTEEHTQNPYYWDNVLAIKFLLESAGKRVLIAFPKNLESPLQLTSAQGVPVQVFSGYGTSDEFKKFNPQLVISNNDFSDSLADWAETIHLPINPPRELGWYQRKKSRYFKHFNLLVNEFAQIVGLDPFLLNVKTEVFPDFELANEESMNRLADKVDQLISELKSDYEKRNIKEAPFVFVKNNSGTYGLGVTRVSSGQEVREWNYKARKKMKAAKGGRDILEVIIQEGIPSRVQSDNSTAEPVIYMIGCELAGGFLRTHAEKNPTESLNSPGAVYKRLCVSDLNVSLEGHPLENVYGWSAKIGLLAIGYEAKEMGIEFKDYAKNNCFL